MVKSHQVRRQKKNAMVIDDSATSGHESFLLPDDNAASANMLEDVKKSTQVRTNKKGSGILQVAGSTHNSRIKQTTTRRLSAKKLRKLRTQEKHTLADQRKARAMMEREAHLEGQEKAQKVYMAEQRRQQGILQKQAVDNVSNLFSQVL